MPSAQRKSSCVTRKIGNPMGTANKLKAAIRIRRASKGPRGKSPRAESRQYTIADLQRARDRVEAAERRIDNDHTSKPNRGGAGLDAGAGRIARHRVTITLSCW